MQLEFIAFGLTIEIDVRPFHWAYARVGRFSSYINFETGKDAPGIWTWRRQPGCFEVWAYWFYAVWNLEPKGDRSTRQAVGLQEA